MICAIGIDADSTFVHFLAEATKRQVSVVAINLKAIVRSGDWRISIPDDGHSFVAIDGDFIELDPQASFFCRIIDLSSVQRDKEDAGSWRNVVNGLNAWLEHIPGKVINRPGSHAHNFCKPLHEDFMRRWGFSVPESLTSSNREQLLTFASSSETILKPLSGIRANSELIEIERLRDEFSRSQGPIHLQKFIPGVDVRAHVVENVVHSELILADAPDYRSGRSLRFQPHQLPEDLERRLILATKTMGLSFAGWDFKLDHKGHYWCLEANPMPGYDGYDRRLGGRITESLLEMLMHPISKTLSDEVA